MSKATPTAPVATFGSVTTLPEISASILKNKFSEVARLASREPLAVSRHNRREFVILTAEHYETLQQSRRAPLENLTAEFDQLITRMNTPVGKRAATSLFSARSAGLGKAAVKAKSPRETDIPVGAVGTKARTKPLARAKSQAGTPVSRAAAHA